MGAAVLFDVDGTLMRAGGAGREGVVRAVSHSLGQDVALVRKAVDHTDFCGRTDTSIFQDVAESLGISWATHAQAVLTQYVQELDEALARATVEVMPGVVDLLAHLEEAGVCVGLLTGNIREGARKKLARIGLAHLVDCPGGFGDNAARRQDVATHAVKQLLLLRQIEPHEVIIIGDTFLDVQAAHHVGAWAVAVATGWIPYEELLGSNADAVLPDLRDPTPILDRLQRLQKVPT